jgi:hypothetical protein
MSRGVLDQAAYDAACAAASWAAAHGKRAIWDAIHHNPDGTRTFRFRYEALKPPRRAAKDQPPSMTHDPDAVWDRVREKSRGAAREAAGPGQGSLL